MTASDPSNAGVLCDGRDVALRHPRRVPSVHWVVHPHHHASLSPPLCAHRVLGTPPPPTEWKKRYKSIHASRRERGFHHPGETAIKDSVLAFFYAQTWSVMGDGWLWWRWRIDIADASHPPRGASACAAITTRVLGSARRVTEARATRAMGLTHDVVWGTRP